MAKNKKLAMPEKDASIGIPSEPSKKHPEKYEIDDAVSTLLRAEEIKGNKHLMPHVHKAIAKKHKAIKSISQLRDIKNKMDMGEDTDEDGE